MKPTKEITTLVKIKVQEELKSKVKGYIKINIEKNTMVVDIFVGYNHTYHITIYNLIEKIVQGWNATSIANFIVKEYKQDILRKYFR